MLACFEYALDGNMLDFNSRCDFHHDAGSITAYVSAALSCPASPTGALQNAASQTRELVDSRGARLNH